MCSDIERLEMSTVFHINLFLMPYDSSNTGEIETMVLCNQFRCIFSLNTLYNTVNLKITVTRHQNSKVPGINLKKTSKNDIEINILNVIKHLKKFLEGFIDSNDNLLNKRLFESFSG